MAAHLIRHAPTGSTLASVLIGCCAGWIVFYCFPNGAPHQVVEIRRDGSPPERYLLALDDPSLARLWQAAGKPDVPHTTPGLRLAKWHRELATYYRQRTEESAGSGDLTPVSGDFSTGSIAAAATLDRAKQSESPEKKISQVSHAAEDPGHPDGRSRPWQAIENEYWRKLENSAVRRIAAAEAELKRRREAATAAFQLGPIVPSSRPSAALALGVLAGLCATVLTTWHRRVCPPLTLGRVGMETSTATGPELVQLQIPADWVRVRQPAEVTARRMAAVLVVAGAGICFAGALLGY